MSTKLKRELRTCKGVELRAQQKEGQNYISGYAATYSTLSEDLGWWRERIMPGAFDRAVNEKQDVRHLINHDANQVLGRTVSGTTELKSDVKGLYFRTLLPDTSFARDLMVSMQRGDITECSFAFIAARQSWVEDELTDDPSMEYIRQIEDVDLYDISIVTYPAYPGTSAEVKMRSMFPDGVPEEIARRREKRESDCNCQCEQCLDGDCENCTDEDCNDPNCRCMRAANWKARAEMRLRLAQAE